MARKAMGAVEKKESARLEALADIKGKMKGRGGGALGECARRPKETTYLLL